MEALLAYLMTYESDTFSATERELDEREAAVIARILIGHWLESLDGAQITAALEQVRDEEMLALDAHKMKAFLLECGWIDCGGGGSYRCKLVKRLEGNVPAHELQLSLSRENVDYAVAMHSNIEEIMWLEKMPKHQLIQMFSDGEYFWTDEQAQSARAEGWILYDARTVPEDKRTDVWMLRAFSGSDRFDSDQSAWLHVTAQAQGGDELCRQAMAFLHERASKEHRSVWVYSMKHWVEKALQAPNAFHLWLQSQRAEKEIGWRPIERFLRSMGVQRSDVGDDWVDICYFDEAGRIPVFKAGTLEQPQWLKAFMQQLAFFSRLENAQPPNVLCLIQLLHLAVGFEQLNARNK